MGPWVNFGSFFVVVVVAAICRPPEVQFVRLKIHYGGNFVNYPCKVYVGGEVYEMSCGLDVD